MPITLTYLGHSGLLISDGTYSLAIDPFLTGNPLAKHTPEDIACNYIALTHGHADHFGDTLRIAQNNDATVIAVYEICEFCREQGLTKLEPANTGGRVYTDFGYVAFTPAFHSSSYEGRYMGQPSGLVVSIGGVKIYHCGDTALFSDMKLIGQIAKPDIAAIPVGDRFTMGPRLATYAAEMIQPKIAIPIHYKTFPQLTSDISEFTPKGVQVRALQPGETMSYG
jgi:L-ascorbate metabolism protein UlaG (beta-lactamase superfamily)